MTPLGVLNFAVLQWFGLRLQADLYPAALQQRNGEVFLESGRWWSRNHPKGWPVSWSLLRWVWPLTGWWSPYRWIARR